MRPLIGNRSVLMSLALALASTLGLGALGGCGRQEVPQGANNQLQKDTKAGSKDSIAKWVEQLKAPSAEARREAAKALGKAGAAATQAITALAAALKDEDPKVRGQAAHALVMMGPAAKSAMSELVEALSDPEAGGYAGTALNLIGPASLPELVRALSDQNVRTRRQAALALVNRRPPPVEAVKAIVAGIEDDDSRVRSHCLGLLGSFGSAGEPAVPEIIRALGHKDLDTKLSAANALGRIGPSAKTAALELSRLLEKPFAQWNVPYVVLEALGRIGPAATDALPKVRELLKDSSADLRVAAATALKKISTKDEPEAVVILASAQKQSKQPIASGEQKGAKTPVGQVQDIGATYNSHRGKTILWSGRVGKDGIVYGDSKSTTTYSIKVKLKEGVLPAAGTQIVFTGTLSTTVDIGTDFITAPDGSQTAVSTVYLTVTEARLVTSK